MNQPTALKLPSASPAPATKSALQASAKNIDMISKAAMEAFASPESFEQELAVAAAVGQLREALTPEVMAEVMALMNTSIGFQTDQDPKKPSASNPHPKPYTVDVVRDCFIESRLRGLHVVGKEFCIISANVYATVNGLERLVKKHATVTDFKDHYDVPRLVGDGKGALVKCRAEWKQDTTPQTLEREFAIRVNQGQGADAILGKCKRKLLSAVYSRLSGVVTPEGEVGDSVTDVTGASAQSTPVKAETLFGGPVGSQTTEAKPEPAATPSNAKTSSAPSPTSTASPKIERPKQS